MREKREGEMTTERYFFLRSILIEWHGDAVLPTKSIVSHDMTWCFSLDLCVSNFDLDKTQVS